MRIALTGPAYSGKTTLADYLEEHCGWTKLNYTDRMKVDLAKALSAIEDTPVTVTEITREKELYRPLLKALASYRGYNHGYGVDELVQEWLASQESSAFEDDVVWDCVRYEDQAEILREYGFVIVEMNVELGTQQGRAYAKGIDAKKLDELMGLEADEGVTPDMWLDGARPTDDLADVLQRLSGMRAHRTRVARKPAEKPLNIYIKYGEPANLAGLN